MLLSTAIEGFLLDKDGDTKDDLSPQTITLYRKYLAWLTRHLNDPELGAITAGDVSGFMRYLEKDYKTKAGAALSGCSRDNAWKAIRSFYTWASAEFNLTRPDRDLPRPAIATEEVIPFTEDEVRKILAACEYSKEANTTNRKPFKMRRPTATRDRSIVLLLLETGIRLGELSRLRMIDVNLENGEIRVKPYRTGKKSKSRSIPFEKGCKKALWRYQNKERIDALEEEPFFTIAPHTIQSLFTRISERSGVSGVHPHRFRHTFAIQYLRNGGDIFTLQRILGHSSLEMCRRYLAIAQGDIKDAHRRASPVDRWRL